MRFRTNKIFEKNKQEKKGIGLGLVYPSAEVIEIIGMLGDFDFVHLAVRSQNNLVWIDKIESRERVRKCRLRRLREKDHGPWAARQNGDRGGWIPRDR